MLSTARVCPEEPAELLDHVFRLSIRLQVVTRGQAHHGPHLLEERLPDPSEKLGAAI